MHFYADEEFSHLVVDELRQFGHDVLTAMEDGRRSTPDRDILARANSLGRVVLTRNRWHYVRLHRDGDQHGGIVSITRVDSAPAVAWRIDAAVTNVATGRWQSRVNLPP